MNIDIDIVDHSPEFLRELNRNIDTTLEAVGLQVTGYAQLELEADPRRIDTGLLRNSLAYALAGEQPETLNGSPRYTDNSHAQSGQYSGRMPRAMNENAVYVGSNVEYAVYVHEGTEKMQANRYIRNAVTKHTDEIQQMIRQGLGEGI